MAIFAPVAPIQVLEGLLAHSPETFGNYHLLLAHHTVEHPQRFSDLFQEAGRAAEKRGQSITVIMDNSIVELGTAVDLEMIAEAVNIVSQHSLVSVLPVLPDIMGQGEETRKAVEEAYPIWEKEMPGDGFMVVCQGANHQDYLQSLRAFGNRERFPKISILGIPRVLHKTCGSRVKAAVAAIDYEESHGIHFLGFSDDITDDIYACGVIPSAGIDSAVPLRLLDVFTEFVDAGKRPPDWFDTAQVSARTIDNLAIARKMFSSQLDRSR